MQNKSLHAIARPLSLFGPWPFYREALSLAIPVMLQSLITGLVSLVDNFMVAGLGDMKMAGVNIANQVNFIFMVIVNVVAMAGGIFLSQHRGAKNREGMIQSFRFKLVMGTAVSVLYFIMCQLFPEVLLSLMVSDNAEGVVIIAEGARYMRAVSFSFIPIALSAAISTSFRDIGEPKMPLIVSTGAAIANTIGNWFLIYGSLGAPRLEVVGAAIATVIARILEILAFLIVLDKRKPDFSFKIKTLFRIDGRFLREVLSRSGMMFFSETAWVVSETITTALYNRRGGAEVVAGMAAGWSVANLLFLVFPAIQTATNVIVGSTLGAGKLDEGRAKARWIMAGSIVFGIASALAAMLSILAVPLVFGNLSGAAQHVTRGIIVVIGIYLPLWCLLNAQFGVSRAGGDTLMGVIVDVGVTYLVFIPAAVVISRYTAWGPVALYGIAKLSDIGKAIVAGWWLKKERWVRNLTATLSVFKAIL